MLRDATGALLDGFTKKIPALSAIQAEMSAPIEALNRFKPRGEGVIEVESNCEELVRALQEETHVPWEIESLAVKTRAILAHFPQFSLAHCSRSANHVAD
ncbi:hypothetical protein NL676_005415 [Syzygium grande]|nr:hypothetical protein NL676_005415 [Syzygium grande]